LGLLALFATMAITACQPGQATIVVALGEEGTANTVEDVEVRLLPYDRDQIFDSLTRAAATPEPEVPADLLAAQAEIAEAQQAWRDMETQWNTLRDTLQKLNTELEGLNPGMSRYRAIFNEWQDQEALYNRAERQLGSLFDNFDALQQAAIGRMDSISIIQADWADQAFEEVDYVIAAKVELSGLEPLADTTDANGVAQFDDVAPGAYWVYARHELPYNELYWNVPIVVTREEPFEPTILSEENAVTRPIF
jgi:hypothetical protein